MSSSLNAVDIDIDSLLNKVEALIKTMHYSKIELSLSPKKKHLITCLKYQGLNQMRSEFIQKLINSIVKYVLSKSKMASLYKELTEVENMDESDANVEIFQYARSYFRTADIKGQFSELLLFNFLQYYFKAIPVVRKMTITTNNEVERHGADAIHLGKTEKAEYVIYLGEAKTYTSGFKAAFKKAINSIITAYNEHRNELQLYKYEEYIEPEVRSLIKEYLNGSIDLPVKLVIIVSYCSGTTPSLQTKDKYIEHYINHVISECSKIYSQDYKDDSGTDMHSSLLQELHYILFPVNELEDLLKEFKAKLGLA